MLWAGWAVAVALAFGCIAVDPEGQEAGEADPSTPSLPAASETVVVAAQADLAARLGVEEDSIGLEAVEERQWPDTSLGCPEPGFFYAQVITPGYRIVLSVGPDEYVYHASTSRAVLCPQEGDDGGGVDGPGL